ncbi:MAG: UDP-N-acetylmuramoyl-L-alanyl-D-glutamate--2,6-diaminopimelate ligase [Candidatus Omnitrophica bacterium]|nr:UDP-N-acetylmuramoyl-L-alanyl-D-glutamate--2,6-diaminopimelate ligase [Candidatus Omnitrophota bacterium]
MLLKDLLKNIYPLDCPQEFGEMDIHSICSDSREVKEASLFVALKGVDANGAWFVGDAVARGAKVVVHDKSVNLVPGKTGTLLLGVDEPFVFLREILSRFYGDVFEQIKPIAVTGTNGKTTVTYLLESILDTVGRKCGIIGTIAHRWAGQAYPAKNTTPSLVDNYRYLAQMVSVGCDYAVMEVSSHALDQGRVEGIPFKTAVFTNLTVDHLDYHKNQEAYFQAKAILFEKLGAKSTAVINVDDSFGQRLVKMSKGQVVSYGIEENAYMTARKILVRPSGTKFMLGTQDGQWIPITTELIGRHNIYNILAAATVCFKCGISLGAIKVGVEKLKCVPGRLEKIKTDKDFSVFVDYAHTEDALENVLVSLKEIEPSRIILVFGCGGDRDKSKRPKMGAVASRLADLVIVTNDNPRSEDPRLIVTDIAAGITQKNFEIVLDRKEAIAKALQSAQAGDVVLIAGKGHEDYQIFKDETVHFDDREVVREFLSGDG